MIFKLIPKIDAVVEMTQMEFNGFTLGGGEIVGTFNNPVIKPPVGVYYWLREGMCIKVIIKEAEARGL